MKKTKEMIYDNLKLVDIVLEVVDARIPVSGRNPLINELTDRKDHILLLNKADLADDSKSALWKSYFIKQGIDTCSVNSREGEGIKQLIKMLEARSTEKQRSGNKKPYRIMVLGVPNSGKSSLINRLSGSKIVGVGDKPGFTRGKQWITLKNKMQLLDTPGILWPKFEDPKVGLHLAFCGSVRDEIVDVQDLALELIAELSKLYPDLLKDRYNLSKIYDDPLSTMEEIAGNRGFLLKNSGIDYERTGKTLLDEFRGSKIGRITLESPDQ